MTEKKSQREGLQPNYKNFKKLRGNHKRGHSLPNPPTPSMSIYAFGDESDAMEHEELVSGGNDVLMNESNAPPVSQPDSMPSQSILFSQNSMDEEPQSSQESDFLSGSTRRRSHAEVRKANSITDSTRYPLELGRFFHPDRLLVPHPKDYKSIESQSKVFCMEPAEDLPEYAGKSWSFVDKCPAGLSKSLLDVLYFFDIMNGTALHSHWNGFVVPSTQLPSQSRLTLKYAGNGKDINGVFYNQYVDSERSFSLRGDDDFMNTSRLLASSENTSSGNVKTSLPLFQIQVGFTSAFFKTEGRDEICLFGVVTVTGLMNVDSLRLIHVGLL